MSTLNGTCILLDIDKTVRNIYILTKTVHDKYRKTLFAYSKVITKVHNRLPLFKEKTVYFSILNNCFQNISQKCIHYIYVV